MLKGIIAPKIYVESAVCPQYLDLSITGDTIDLAVMRASDDGTYAEMGSTSIRVSALESKEQVLALYFSDFGDLIVCDWEKASLANSNFALKEVTSDRSAKCVFYSNGTDYAILCHLPLKTSETCEETTVNTYWSKYFQPLFGSSFNSSFFKIKKAKRDLISDLDYSVSLAYLEAQVDILSKLMFTLLDAHSEITGSIGEYADIKRAVSNTSVLNIKSIAKCLEEININKQNVRTLQEAYYAAKGRC
jgi:hypothetical protein